MLQTVASQYRRTNYSVKRLRCLWSLRLRIRATKLKSSQSGVVNQSCSLFVSKIGTLEVPQVALCDLNFFGLRTH